VDETARNHNEGNDMPAPASPVLAYCPACNATGTRQPVLVHLVVRRRPEAERWRVELLCCRCGYSELWTRAEVRRARRRAKASRARGLRRAGEGECASEGGQ
jgi:5-methylcytosine-specific restriction endonuclease McrA